MRVLGKGGFVKTVLFVAYYFPPILAPGAMRPLGFCRYLEMYDWRPWVLTTLSQHAYPPHQIDEELAAKFPGHLKIERVPYSNPLHRMIALRDGLRRSLSHYRASEKVARDTRSSAHVSGRAASYTQTRRSVLKDLFLDWVFAFPDPQRSWFRPAVRRFASLRREDFPDAVVATGGPWTSFLIGRSLARRFNVPLILDYRDPWTSNPYSSFTSSLLNNRARQAEQAFCSSAARIITNTEELRQQLCADYPEILHKCVTIPNGFDREALGINNDQNSPSVLRGSNLARKEGYELSHFGTVYGKRTPLELFRAVWELYQDRILTPAQFRMRFVGAWEVTEEICETMASNLEKQGFLRREPPVTHQRCIREMNQADILLVLQPDSPLQIPQKIYEYLAVGCPLLLIGGQGATANLLARHQLNMGCPNNTASIKRLVQQLVGGELRLNSLSAGSLERFEYRTLTGKLAAQLDAVCGEQKNLVAESH